MGYTHYWEAPTTGIAPTQWDDFSKKAQLIINNVSVPIPCGSPNPLYIEPIDLTNESDATRILINGVGDSGYETFYLPQDIPEFDFCKTAQKPYDIVVVAILTLAHHLLGVNVSSDGYKSDWTSGVALLNRVLNTSYKTPEFC